MLCFVCLVNNKEITLPIFGKHALEYNISYMIEKHLNFKVGSNNNEICDDCWNKLADFHEFYENVTAAHAQLGTAVARNIVGDDNITIKEEFLEGSDPFEAEEDTLTDDPFLNIALETDGIDSSNGGQQIITDKNTHAEDETQPAGDSDSDTSTTTTRSNRKQSQKLSKKQRRNYFRLLEENSELIKKHIRMFCQICQYYSEDFCDIVAHYKEKHGDTKPHIKCCERKLDCPSDILQHAYYHEDPNSFKCNECGKTYMNNTALKDHYRRHHEPEINLSFKCDQCSRKFARKNLLEHHRAKHVPKTERSHYCVICNPKKAFANEYILQIHIKNRHYKATNICHVCAKEIHDKQAFEKHVRSHFESSGPRLKCPRDGCESWLKDKDNLRQHLRRFHDTEQHKCPQCGRICKNKHALACHMKNTHSTQVYTCEECRKTFKSQQTLKEHMAGHTGEPLYNCRFCSRMFNSKANMYSHIKKSHSCEWEASKKSKVIAREDYEMNSTLGKPYSIGTAYNFTELSSSDACW
ncbi:transcription factor grauzone-like [Musca vetustissima]|uniref:transcription factor grauzone-like n=1 Tax=Musca vetustissima TaxID=27455 RepID=UPI002AB75544|nr:transcription factor grauzone-like [Musca vetustissima]